MKTYRFIDAERASWSARLICRVLGVSRAAYYAWRKANPSPRSQEDATLVVHIKAVHRRSRGTYGSPRVHAELQAEGFAVGRRRVARLMHEHGLEGTPKKRFTGSTTDSVHDDPIAPNHLARKFEATSPNLAWVGDITYLRTQAGWVYLAVLIDLFSRKVVGWSLASQMQTELCLDALGQAVALRSPPEGLVHHTDRGSQYTSGAYREALAELGAVASMSRKGNCWDNAVAESFFGTLEQELVRTEGPWVDEDAALNAVSSYIHDFYNDRRRHSTLRYQSPVDFEAQHRQVLRVAA